ncbi:translation initiation factor IF-2-like [Coturnix japonica]|uniref:translation initiation factor IF-2-like n=1 Tax=Coturnix japonica TaxID=93934 RepID=UPI0013A5E3AF|nr:translation initiation factor IF-2-like [Coturnix japonica]
MHRIHYIDLKPLPQIENQEKSKKRKKVQIIRTNGAHSSGEEEGEERGNFHAAPKRITLRSPRPASPHGRWERGGRPAGEARRLRAQHPARPGPCPAPPAREAPPRALPARPARAIPRAAPARRVPPPPGPARGGGLRPAPSRRSLGALVGRAARLPPLLLLLLASPSFLPRPGLRLALTRLPRPCPARGACARLSLRGTARRRRRWRPGRRGRAVGERAGKEERGEGGGEGWGGKAREGDEKRGEKTAAALPGRDLWRRVGRALGRLLRRPLGERRGISELGALRCQPGHHLTLGRLALDAASPALAPPAVGGEQRRGAAAGRRATATARGAMGVVGGSAGTSADRSLPPPGRVGESRAGTAARPPAAPYGQGTGPGITAPLEAESGDTGTGLERLPKKS